MDRVTAHQLLERLQALDPSSCDRASLLEALQQVVHVRHRVDVIESCLARALDKVSDLPETSLAEVSDLTRREAAKVMERARLLERDEPACRALAVSFGAGEVSSAHVDTFVRTLRDIEPELRDGFLADTSAVHVAQSLSVRRFGERLRLISEGLRRKHGIDRLARQRRRTTMDTWVDRSTGMWRISASFDPETAVALSARIEAKLQELMASALPETAPSDPSQRIAHLRALAFAQLLCGDAHFTGGAADMLVVVDTTRPTEFGEAAIDWGLPVDLPMQALERYFNRRPRVTVVDIARNGAFLDRSEKLDLGRTTRLANRAQRQALRGFHPTCVIPDCPVPFRSCDIHHVTWWRHGGGTDLENLAPLCSHHHHQVHDAGWVLTLSETRSVTVQRPDGRVMATGPPSSVQVQVQAA